MRVAAEAMPVSGRAPAVSVIIATCGRPQFLLDCVASILRNDFQDFEIIIVDQSRDRILQVELSRRFRDDGRLVYVVLDQATSAWHAMRGFGTRAGTSSSFATTTSKRSRAGSPPTSKPSMPAVPSWW